MKVSKHRFETRAQGLRLQKLLSFLDGEVQQKFTDRAAMVLGSRDLVHASDCSLGVHALRETPVHSCGELRDAGSQRA
jgi:hypothetical protein